MYNKISLTKTLTVEQGAHILYFYNETASYIENATSYIISGIELDQHVILVDSEEHYQMIIKSIEGHVDVAKLHYFNNYHFYELYHDFHYDRILSKLESVIQPYVENEKTVRLWGHVDWIEQANILDGLQNYESTADLTVSELGYTTVCAYDAIRVPAYIQTEMMKSHEYFMTDDLLIRSGLYKQSSNSATIFPSLSIQQTIESEVDFYKQKLEFVHVVSHEVRNPLTVIKAYASLLLKDELDEGRKAKLTTIKNYSMVIDNEISHIINTEQMLSTDAFWQKKLLLIYPAILEAIEIMQVKAQTQNIKLITDIQLTGKEIIESNLIGFKLILTNLLSNAIKYSFEDGKVWLTICKKQNRVMIEVIDEGTGMSEEQQHKLFRKYEKINQDKSGQGIGLFMVKKLIDNFDGSIEVQSQAGMGSTFRVELPVFN